MHKQRNPGRQESYRISTPWAPSLRAKSSSNLNLCESAAEGSAPPAANDEDSGFEELTVTPSKANNGANGEAESAEPGTVTPQ